MAISDLSSSIEFFQNGSNGESVKGVEVKQVIAMQ